MRFSPGPRGSVGIPAQRAFLNILGRYNQPKEENAVAAARKVGLAPPKTVQ